MVFLPSFPTFLSQTFTKCVLCTKHCAGAIVGSETSMMLALLDVTVYWKETHTKQIKRELHTGLRTKKVVHKGNYNFTWERCFIDPIPSKFISTGWPKFTIFVSGMLFPFSLIIHNLYGWAFIQTTLWNFLWLINPISKYFIEHALNAKHCAMNSWGRVPMPSLSWVDILVWRQVVNT